MLEYIFPKKIISKQDASVSENFLFCRDIQVVMSDVPSIVISEKGFIVLDFGKEMCGRLHILAVDNSNGEIHVRLGESVAECYYQTSAEGECVVDDNGKTNFYKKQGGKHQYLIEAASKEEIVAYVQKIEHELF